MNQRKGTKSMEYVFVFGIIGLYFALQLWILPAFGIPTCMSGRCGPSGCTVPQQAEQMGSGETESGKTPANASFNPEP
jgi:hypothetical protein